jgi:TatD DNase family protein
MASVITAPKPVGAPVEAPELQLIDTHAHLHFDQYRGEVDAILHRAGEAGVGRLLSVGVSTADSLKAVELAATYENVWASVGIHPHDAGEAEQGMSYLADLAGRRKVVAIGECGLDYFKAKTTPEQQELALRAQIELALTRELPLIFHVRDAFPQFFDILRDYSGVRGVVHCFTAGRAEMEQAVAAGLYVALNGIMTFTKDESQLEAAKLVPSERLLLETDSPFLSPAPYRGKPNEPARTREIAEFLTELRGVTLAELAQSTSTNAINLFGLSS